MPQAASRYSVRTTVKGNPMTAASTAASTHPDSGCARVLVVEDNVINQQLVLAMLARAGFVAEVAMDGREALALLRIHPFDLVLMDLQTPLMDGLQAMRELRSGDSGVLDPRIPVIALTASAFAEDRARSLAAGMNDLLTKPLDPRRLLETLARWLPARPAVAVLPEGATSDAPAEPGNLQILDRLGLLDRMMDDAELSSEVLGLFVHEYPAMREALRSAIDCADPVAILNLTHTLKGAAANVGALRVCEVATRLEQQAADGAAARLGDLFLELDRHLVEFERVVAALRCAGAGGFAV